MDTRARAAPLGCIVGEPTEMKVVTGHKGKKNLHCAARGLAGHSSNPGVGVNAVEAVAEIAVFLKGLARRSM